MFIFLTILLSVLGICMAIGACMAFAGFIEDDVPGFLVLPLACGALLCGSFLLVDDKKGMVYENVTEIQEINSYQMATPFTLAKRTVLAGTTTWEDDDEKKHTEDINVETYVLQVAGEKPVEMQGDTPIIKTLDPKFPPALVCKYKVITKGNFWHSASNEPVDDEVEWYIQIPADSKLISIK